MISSQRSANGFVHEIVIAAPIAVVREFLADLGAQAEMHPLIESITPIQRSPQRPSAAHYRVRDRISLGLLRFRVTYTAALETVSETEIRGDAWQRPNIHLQTTYALSPTLAGTRVIERVDVRAPWLLRRVTVSQACSAHRETLLEMAERLSTPERS